MGARKKLRRKLQKAHSHTGKVLKRLGQAAQLIEGDDKVMAFVPVIEDLHRIKAFVRLVAHREGVQLKD